MRQSDIFDNYIKIAEEKGMLSDDSKKELSKNHRADSLSMKDIEKLYAKSPDKNMTELAHPSSVVISPTYDKINSIIKNDNDAQNITLNIINRKTDGIMSHKYAQQELTLSLIRVANLLDNQNKTELRILADVCAEQSIKKEAAFPWLIGMGIVAGIAYYKKYSDEANKGFKKNYEYLVKQVNDLIGDHKKWGFGKSYSDDLSNFMKEFLEKLSIFYAKYTLISDKINAIEKPKDEKALIAMATDNEISKLAREIDDLNKDFTNLQTYTNGVIEQFSKDEYKAKNTKDTGWFQGALEYVGLMDSIISPENDEFVDVIKAIKAFNKSIIEMQKNLIDSARKRKEYSDKLKATVEAESSRKMEPANDPEDVPVTTTRTPSMRSMKSVKNPDMSATEEYLGSIPGMPMPKAAAAKIINKYFKK